MAADSTKGQVNRPLLLAIRLFAFIALAVSVYLLYVTFGGTSVAGCGPDSGCDKVLQSRWSKWFGIPVSLYAVLLYGAMLILTFRLSPAVLPERQRDAWVKLIPLAALALASIVWFSVLQYLVLKQFCPYCMTDHICGLIAASLLFLLAPFGNPPEKSWQAEKQVFVQPSIVPKLLALAFVAFALFAAGQIAYHPKTFSAREIASTAPATNAPLPALETNRWFVAYNGLFRFDLNIVPLIGKPTASNAIISLFDYTCHHCRIMHWHLMEAMSHLSNQLAIVSLPMPLDNKCNYTVRQTPAPHTNACEYAKIGLAIWRANPAVHHQFEDWLFTPEQTPLPPVVRQYASALVGSNQLARALQDPWVEQELQAGITIYATNFYHLHNGSMPQIIVGQKLSSGTFGSVADFYKLLDEQLGIKPPSAGRDPASAGPGRPPPSG